MADEEERTAAPDSKTEAPPAKRSLAQMMPWLVPVVAIVVCAGVGFTVARLFGTRGNAQTVSGAERTETTESAADLQTDAQSDTQPGWYYDMEALVANLNEPGVTRYARVALTLEISSSMKQADGVEFFETNKPRLKNWLTLYLSNQRLEDTRGEQNLRRMQVDIADVFNRGLFPTGRPKIKQVLFKELSIQ